MAENKTQKNPDTAREIDLQSNLNNIKEDMSKLRTDLTKLSMHVKERGKSYAKSTTDKIVESIGKELDRLGEDKDKVIGKIREELERVQEEGRKKVETVENKIQENPFKSILIAFIFGLFLGKFSDRK